MDGNLLKKDLFKSYSKYCYPIVLFVLVLIVVLLMSFNNIISNVSQTMQNLDAQTLNELNYNIIGVQLLQFITFILACVLPIIIALLMTTYEKSNTEVIDISGQSLLSSKIISGALFIVIPFLANVLLYIILVWGGFFGTFQNELLIKLVLTTIFGFSMSMLTFLLITIINMTIKNPIVDSLLTLAIALLIMEIFYRIPINPVFLIIIVVFVWLALIYLARSIEKKQSKK